MGTIKEVSRQWAKRPPDERFLTLEALRESVASRTRSAAVLEVETPAVSVSHNTEGELFINSGKFDDGAETLATFTNWSMGQLASICGAPAGYIARLPAGIAADCLNHGISTMKREKNLMLFTKDIIPAVVETDGNLLTMSRRVPNNTLRSVTSMEYGRIWDIQVVDSILVMNLQQNNRWVVPAASYKATDPLRATTIYGSDRDIFVFLCDPANPVMVGDQPKFRGFYVYNSEVGAQVLGVATFLYDTVCDNRIVWGVSGFTLMKRRHTSLAPQWFDGEGKNIIMNYANAEASKEEAIIRKAMSLPLAKTADDVLELLNTKTSFGKRYAMEALKYAEDVGGDPTLLWNVVSGLTAVARNIPHSDTRISCEIEAGKLLNIAA